MEDNNIKTEENKIWEGSQKGTEQNNKESSQPTDTETASLETHPSTPTPPPPPESPCPAPGASGGPPPGGNNAKWAAVANGQPPATSSPPQRYMPREVPPRFRCQQDHKVLLKRGQPPLSCMLLGGGNGGEGTPPLSCGDGPESNAAGASDVGSGSPLSPMSTSAATTPTAASEPSSYANPDSGEGSGGQSCSVDADTDKVIADPAAATAKPGEWPVVVEADLSVALETDDHRAQSASCGDGCLQQPQQQQQQEQEEEEEMREQERLLQEVLGGSEAAAVEGEGDESASGPPSASASSPSKCPESAGTTWLSSSSQAENAESVEGTAQSQSPPTPTTTVVASKGSLPPPPENQESLLGISSTGSSSGGEVSGANSNPNCNSSAWPALALDETRDGATGAANAAVTETTNAPLSPSSPVSSTSESALVASLPPAPPPPTSLANQELQEKLSAGGGGGVGGGGGGGGERVLSPWDNQGSEVKTGPKTGAGVLGNDDDMDSGIPGGAVENLSTSSTSFSARSSASSSSSSSSSSAASSWKSPPQQPLAPPLIPSSSNPSNTGASRADSWDMGMGGAGSSSSGGVWGSTNEKGGQGQGQEQASDGWGAVLGGEGSFGGGMTRGVSQGGWDMEVGGVGGGADTDVLESAGRPCSSAGDSIAAGGGDGSGSNSCGGSVVSGGGEDGSLSQDSHSSLTFASAVTGGGATADKAEDNQKGDGDASAAVFTGQEESSSGGEDTSVSSGTQQHQDQAQGSASGPETPGSGGTTGPATAALQNMLGRGDLDPRVLCNTGWGQTQIRQNVAWDLEAEEAAKNRGRSFRGGRPSGYPGGSGSTDPDPATASQRFGMGGHSKDGWHDVNPSRGPPPQDSPAQKAAMEGTHQGRMTRDFGGRGDSGYGGMESQGKGWGSKDDPNWGEAKRDERDGAGEWGTFGEQGTSSSSSSGAKGGSSGWGDTAQEEKGTGGWKELSTGTGDWRQNQSGSGSGGSWKDSKGSCGDEGSWSNWDDGRPKKSWGSGGGGGGGGGGGSGGDAKPYQGWGGKPMTTNQPPAIKGPNQQQQSQAPQPPQQQQQQQQLRSDPRAMQQEGRGRPGGTGPPATPHHNQNQSSGGGWTAGPIPQVAPSSEPSGWEEPSPQSISRKMEIDDGTSAWGDPTCYNTKSVNLWDKNSGQGQGQGGQGQGPPPPKPMQPPPPSQQPAMGRPPGPPMNRDSNMGKAPPMWGGGRGPPPDHSVDNGTSAWGKGPEASSGWGEPDDPGKGGGGGWGGRSPNPIKSGSKTMQEGWGEMESSMGTSRHSSWEEEDEGSNMWNSGGTQGNSASYGSGGWGHANKRGNNKGGMKGDSWMNPVNRQFSNMGMMDDDLQDKRMDGDKRGMSDYNGEMRKGRGGGGGGVFRTPGSKEVGAGEAGPYFDKMGGHGVYGGSGGMPPIRGMHPINTPQGLRAQVPPQFLSPQVPGSMLKQMPPPTGNLVGGIGGVPGGVFTPQLSPQHLAMLSGIHPHMQQILACQLLLQQQQQQQLLQNQRKFPQPMRQQPDPQQLARIMAVLQQQRQQQQQQGVGGMGTVGSKMSPSHLGGAPSKHPIPEHLQHPGLGGTLAELQAKAQGGYPGYGSAGGNLSGLELGGMVGAPGGVKDPVGPQSRFKWMMEGHSTAPSPPDPTLHKNGPLPTPGKPYGSTPYAQYDLLGGDGSGMASQVLSDGWQRSPGIGQGPIIGTSTWPPEFQPGVPWKGIQSADPESDPYMTPGGVLTPHEPPNLSDPDHQLLRDDTGSNPALNTLLPSHGAWPYSASESPLTNAHSSAKYSEYKSSWPLEPIGHSKSWKTNRNSSQPSRPPPGLTNQKQGMASPWPTGGPRLARGWGGGSSQDTRFESDSAWSDGTAPRGSCWLLLSNLTPQIDGSTLRTICMQHGPLLTFHLGLTQGSALIRYSTPLEAAKAQSALHMCVLGNTTILAEFVSEEDVARYFAHSQAVAAGGAGGAAGSGVGVTVAGGMGVAPGSAAPGTPGASVGAGAVAGGTAAGARKPGERERGRGSLPGGSSNGAEAGVVGSSAGPATTGGWQSLDVAGSPLDVSSPQGSGLGIFAQWSTNGAGEGEGDGVGIGAGTGVVVEPGRGGLWGGRDPWVPQQ